MNKPYLDSLIMLYGNGSQTQEEKESYRAGIDGEANPHPSIVRCCQIWQEAFDNSNAIYYEMEHMRRCSSKF